MSGSKAEVRILSGCKATSSVEHVTGLCQRVLKELPCDLHLTETVVVLGKSAKKGIWSSLTAS